MAQCLRVIVAFSEVPSSTPQTPVDRFTAFFNSSSKDLVSSSVLYTTKKWHTHTDTHLNKTVQTF